MFRRCQAEVGTGLLTIVDAIFPAGIQHVLIVGAVMLGAIVVHVELDAGSFVVVIAVIGPVLHQVGIAPRRAADIVVVLPVEHRAVELVVGVAAVVFLAAESVTDRIGGVIEGIEGIAGIAGAAGGAVGQIAGSVLRLFIRCLGGCLGPGTGFTLARSND